MMKNLRKKLFLAALPFVAASLLATNTQAASYSPANTFYAAGSSAMFNTFALAAGLDNAWPGNSALCGEHHWTQSNGAYIVDSRSTSIAKEKGNIWIVWNDAAVNQTSGGRVCAYVSVDSIVGVRAYAADAVISLGTLSPANTPDGNIVPLLGLGENLPTNIYSIVNGAAINVAMTDIRPEDAKFATMRVLTTPAGTQIVRRGYTGLGYGPNSIGTPIYSSQGSPTNFKQANPVDFAIVGADPISQVATPRSYKVLSIGASPVLVIANVTNTSSGHLGDGNFTNINRYSLAGLLAGKVTHIRDLAPVSGLPDVATKVFVREPLSGTYNTMEFCIPLSREIYTFTPGSTSGQETSVDPTNTTCSGAQPCSSPSGNPLWSVASNGATRGRVIGTGEMVSTVNSTADSIGYSFWGYSNFQSKTNLKYMTVDGVDPLYSSSSANSNGTGVIPQCATSGTVVTSCPSLSFPNIVNGTYPIWSMLRAMYDPTDSTLIANAIIAYAQHAAVNEIPDFVPATSMQVFRSHYNQSVVTSTGDDMGPNNGYKTDVPETGGDMGGAVLTVQSELDYITDTNAAGLCGTGCQQVNLFQ